MTMRFSTQNTIISIPNSIENNGDDNDDDDGADDDDDLR